MAETSKLENVIASVQKYLSDQLESTYTIDWHNAEVDTEAETQWITPRFMEPAKDFIRNYTSGAITERGYIVFLPLNINVFTRAAAQTDAYAHLTIRDAVFASFKPLTEIDFTDHVGGGVAGALGSIVCWDVADTPLPDEDGLIGHNVTVTLRYEESF